MRISDRFMGEFADSLMIGFLLLVVIPFLPVLIPIALIGWIAKKVTSDL